MMSRLIPFLTIPNLSSLKIRKNPDIPDNPDIKLNAENSNAN